MRAVLGVSIEVLLMAVVLVAATHSGLGFPYSLLALILAQVLSTFLVHCPAHYAVGRLLGIRFDSITFGKTSMSAALPVPLRRAASYLVVFSVRVNRGSLRDSTPRRARAMYFSGVSASVASAFLFAIYVTSTGAFLSAFLCFVFAFVYLASDAIFSPKVGDIARARRLTKR